MNQVNESVEVLNASLEAYQAIVDNKMQKMEQQMMETKNLDNSNVHSRLEQLSETIRRMEMKSIVPGVDEENPDAGADAELVRYMRTGQVPLEKKSVGHAEAGLLISPKTIGTIIDNMCGLYPILGHVNTVETRTKHNIVPMSANDASSAIWVNDEGKFDDNFVVKLENTDVHLKTCVSAVSVTRAFTEDMADDSLFTWMHKRISSDFGLTLSKGILGLDDSLGGLLKSKSEKMRKVDNAVTLQGLMRMMGALDSRFLHGAKWYMSPKVLTDLMSLVTASGESVLLRYLTPSAEEGAAYNLFGKPVFVCEELSPKEPSDKTPQLLFCNPKEAYTLLKHANVKFLHVLDNAFAETVKYVYRMRVGGLITNQAAFVVGM